MRWVERLFRGAISRRKARMHQLLFEKGHFVCPVACCALNVSGIIADVRMAEALYENSTWFTKNLARAKTACGYKTCPKARVSCCSVRNYARFPTATQRDGVCATAVFCRIMRMHGMSEHSYA